MMLKKFWYQLPPSVVQWDAEEANSWVMLGVELLGHRFGSQLFPVLFKWFILSVSQKTACKIVALFVSCVKAETGTTHPAGLYILSNKAGLNLIWSLQAWLDISTVKGSRELCIDSLIKTFQMFVARSLLTGTTSVIPDSKVLPYIIFLLWYLHPASCLMPV